MGDRNAPADRSPIIFWSSMIFIVLLIAIFMLSGWFFTNIGMLIFFAMSFGFGMLMQCTTFNFENKEG
ncbi:hypothetical protein DY130_04870 [Apilactobacillus micheneri]|uniref:Uncharacterized protein n=1 Tax=Apilactobacillus micheneri TaxID=1899430 RepID=A0A9Q8MTP8_9LACO|nr:hypothetical protein DY121_04875 [Apilactobacillus micheneri]TPR43767.1 hypothetical protein DY130_04870 [Apilactobacillus micheneri]TPR45320.1 hypothetical protein DY128_04870 [Apilactobacillus micheneri]